MCISYWNITTQKIWNNEPGSNRFKPTEVWKIRFVFRKVAPECSCVVGSDLSAKLKTCLQKLSSMENIQQKIAFTFFRLFWWYVFVFLLTLGCILKTTIMKCLYLKFIWHMTSASSVRKKQKKTFTSKNYCLWMRRLIDQQLWKVGFSWKMIYKSGEKVEFHGHNIPDISLEGSLAIGNHLTLSYPFSKCIASKRWSNIQKELNRNSTQLHLPTRMKLPMGCHDLTSKNRANLNTSSARSASAHRLVCRHSCAGPPVLFKCLVDKVKAMHAMRGLSGNVRMSEWFRLLMLQTDNSWWWWRGI